MPCAEISPTEVALHHTHILRLLQYSLINRKVRIRREILHHIPSLSLKTIHILSLIEVAQHRRQELHETFTQIVHVAQEQSSIPIKLATLHKHLCEIPVRLLSKRLHLIEVILHPIAKLNITITRLRTRRLHTHRKQSLVTLNKLQSLQHITFESLLIKHNLIRRRSYQTTIRIKKRYSVVSPRQARSRITINRFSQNLLLRKLRQLLTHQVTII